jgi:AcrR family transcriptional regulator
MGISERKLRDKEEMKNLILSTAMRLYLEEGYGKMSIRRIADKIEYSPATIYLYFKDKDDILYALHTTGFNKLFKCQQAAQLIDDPRERLLKHGEIYIRFALENPEYYNLMFITRGPARKFSENDEWIVGRRSYEFFQQDVERAMNAGVLPRSDVQIAAFGLWSVAHGIVALILRNRCVMLDQKKLTETALHALRYVLQISGLSIAVKR